MMQESKVALISCSVTSISQAIALELSKQGYRIGLIGPKKSTLDLLIENLVAISPLEKSELRAAFLALELDISNTADYEDELERNARQFIEKFNRIDLLLNDADYAGQGLELHDERFMNDFCRITRDNIEIATRLSQLMSKHLIESSGIVINLASADMIGSSSPGTSSSIGYGIAKAGLAMMTKALANAFQGSSVRTVGIASNGQDNKWEQSEKDFLDKLVKSVVFLASEKANFIHGTTIEINRCTI